uniref:Uncharacterized protein n=1 Tax=Timema poppense TaxID=170557 RepID=A0A7R9GYM6_TIMPO|nr:unnamed protein product [Timema poppensis]
MTSRAKMMVLMAMTKKIEENSEDGIIQNIVTHELSTNGTNHTEAEGYSDIHVVSTGHKGVAMVSKTKIDVKLGKWLETTELNSHFTHSMQCILERELILHYIAHGRALLCILEDDFIFNSGVVGRVVGGGHTYCSYAPKVSAEGVPLVVNATTKSRLPVVES